MDEQQELLALRKSLDVLNSMRLSGSLGERASELYDSLCDREAELLHQQRAVPSA